MGRWIQKLVHDIRRFVVVTASLGVVATGIAVVESSLPSSVAEDTGAGGWGSESLVEKPPHASMFSPIGVANACGLGASSCFKCHNGRRADKPNMDEGSAPWHAQHEEVNHSCAGCHDGNPRIIRKPMAHRNLIVNPNQKPGQSCASCHDEGESDEYLQRYLNVDSGEE